MELRGRGFAAQRPLTSRLVALGLASLTLIGVGGWAIVGQAANNIGGNFEIDTNANLKVNGSSPNIDWLEAGTNTLMTGVIKKADKDSGGGDDSFGQGTKEDTAVPTVVDGGIPPNKSDLKMFGVYKEPVGNKSYLNLFWTRVQDPSGTTNMDFEFNQSQTLSANGVTPVRTANDLLITYDLSNGGTVATISMRTWNGSAWGPATALSNALGTINTSAIPAGEADAVGPLSVRTFGEASIDLSQVFPAGQCRSFGSTYLKSRSSDSFTAALKDFIAPVPVNLSNCGTINIHKQDDAGTALAGAQFTLYKDVSPQAPNQTAAGTEDKTTANTVGTCTTADTGNCSFTDVGLGRYWVVETVTPANHNTAPDQAVNIVTGDQVVALTFVNPRQPGTINVHKQDDTGAALAGAVFTLYVDAAPTGGTKGAGDTTSLGTCTTDQAGNCTFTSVQLGYYWVVETTTPSGYETAANQAVHLATGGQTVSLTFTDPRYFKVIVLVCKEADDSLYASNVTFGNGSPEATLSSSTNPTAAQLCTLKGATLDGVKTGTYSASVVIP